MIKSNLKLLATVFFIFCSLINGWSQKSATGYTNLLLADTHNDILTAICTEPGIDLGRDMTGKTYSDFARWKAGGLNWQLFSIWCDGNQTAPYAWACRELDSLDAIIARFPTLIEMARSTDDVLRIRKQGKIAAMAGVEGGHMIDNDLSKLDSFYQRGVRYMTLTWNNSTDWATSAMDETLTPQTLNHTGLTDFGKQVVQRMNKLGILVDLSHVGEQTFWDAIHSTKKPVLVSHSCSYSLCPVFRNLKDDQIRAVKENDGLICVNFYSGFVDSNFSKRSDEFNARHQRERDSLLPTVSDPYFVDQILFNKYPEEVASLRPPLSMLLDHIDYLVKVGGIDHVGIGSDFDGISSSPLGLDDVSDYPELIKGLQKRGYSEKDIRKICGENLLRVLKANQP